MYIYGFDFGTLRSRLFATSSPLEVSISRLFGRTCVLSQDWIGLPARKVPLEAQIHLGQVICGDTVTV
jgi:hypothetical protein